MRCANISLLMAVLFFETITSVVVPSAAISAENATVSTSVIMARQCCSSSCASLASGRTRPGRSALSATSFTAVATAFFGAAVLFLQPSWPVTVGVLDVFGGSRIMACANHRSVAANFVSHFFVLLDFCRKSFDL